MDRKALILSLEELLKSRVIVYATGDRPGQETQIGDDAIPAFYQHLEAIGRTERIALLLYSRGGHTMSGFAIANALREFAKDVHVLVPFRAHSCATLISLAASAIYMSPFGQLSPIDPSITHPLGPSVQEGQQTKFIPVSVEDVAAFFLLARQEAHITDPQMAEVFAHLSRSVNPLALGAVFRAREQIGMLGRKLLQRHMSDQPRIERIVSSLTRELLSHDYMIGRAEALDIGLPVQPPNEAVETPMWQLYLDLAAEMKLSVPWTPEGQLEGQPVAKTLSCRVVIESARLKHIFATEAEFRRVAGVKDGIKIEGVHGRVLQEGWRAV